MCTAGYRNAGSDGFNLSRQYQSSGGTELLCCTAPAAEPVVHSQRKTESSHLYYNKQITVLKAELFIEFELHRLTPIVLHFLCFGLELGQFYIYS